MLKTRFILLLLAAVSFALVVPGAVAQLSYSKGQPVSPAYEGWEQRADGSYDLIFGYMNDNWEEELDVPVGPDNNIGPGIADQGQPTHFYPRRNRFVFSVNVPKDFGNKELVWTLTTHGQTIKAYGTLRLDYAMDNVVEMSETGALGAGSSTPEIRANKPPVIEIAGDSSRTVKVGQPLDLKTNVTDDGVPKQKPRRTGLLNNPAELAKVKDMRLLPPYSVTVNAATGLWVALQVYRADDGPVHITPLQPDTWEDTRIGANSEWAALWEPPPPPPGNDWTATAVFDKPGNYVLRWHASDGALTTDHDINVKVVP